jgi:hypothetical protein
MPISALACDCITPNPEMDQEILDNSAFIGSFEVEEASAPDWSKESGARIFYTLKVNDIYHARLGLDIGNRIIVHNNLADGCSRHIETEKSYDLIIYKKELLLELADMCTELSEGAWLKLKPKEKE